MWKKKFVSAENLEFICFLEMITLNLRGKGSQVNIWCKSLEHVET